MSCTASGTWGRTVGTVLYNLIPVPAPYKFRICMDQHDKNGH
eukprot:SAG11_NODE_43562_length_164_cov_39.861538_1_plen_41_part_01